MTAANIRTVDGVTFTRDPENKYRWTAEPLAGAVVGPFKHPVTGRAHWSTAVGAGDSFNSAARLVIASRAKRIESARRMVEAYDAAKKEAGL